MEKSKSTMAALVKRNTEKHAAQLHCECAKSKSMRLYASAGQSRKRTLQTFNVYADAHTRQALIVGPFDLPSQAVDERLARCLHVGSDLVFCGEKTLSISVDADLVASVVVL